ncbi:MAG: histidinol-phosphatase HisJ family protein [Clostridiales Family XIII bacterium]|jgi:histidinol-phosphatase (PHP family)|nr:histidinol-phosphatase HisJ family protein [Clostridiales Family XIII bacterium]
MYDYHTHSSFSGDSDEALETMVLRAISLGIKEYAVTDHYDPNYRNAAYDFGLDSEAYTRELERIGEKYSGKIKLVKGLELGIQHDVTEACRAMTGAYPFDFIIGSFHCAEGFEICAPEYVTGRRAEDVYRGFYAYVLQCLKLYKDYDVLGHLNVIDRYAARIPENEAYYDLVEDIVRLLAADGKGIEINTSCFRYNMGERTTPTADMLRLYVLAGGEIVTVGSDAHRASDVGFMLDRARGMARDAGLKYLATFENRAVKFVKL